MTQKIIASGDAAAIVLPREALDELGVGVGDDVEVMIENRAIVVRSREEAARARQVEATTEELLECRRVAYEELAKGVD